MTQKAYNAQANAESVYAERALLVMATSPHLTASQCGALEEEMKRLSWTAGLNTVETVRQSLRFPNAKTLIGKGKVEEIAGLIAAAPEIDPDHRENQSIDIVLFGCDLSPVQQRNLEKATGRRVIDRSELILDIFAQHAITRDGKIQVELAQLQYLKPRLVGRGLELSRLGGGIGTRGPGETKLEVDRRKIDGRIRKLKEEYKKCREVGRVQRLGRKRDGLLSIALVGYTNAGKSTILNRLTKANVQAQDLLFCTLDTTTRRMYLPDGTRMLLSDTVGFIEDLPEPLLGAFRATLAEVEEADGLIHVLDASSDDAERHIEAVMGVLKDLKADQKPILTILNKRDLVEEPTHLRMLERMCAPAVAFSALHEKDLYPLFEAMRGLVDEARRPLRAAREDEEEE
ncbi:MAG: GTPase HflX [bacterium]|jgi:GTP-binding protein HflX|nr:GTPase HflX [bacterium]